MCVSVSGSVSVSVSVSVCVCVCVNRAQRLQGGDDCPSEEEEGWSSSDV